MGALASMALGQKLFCLPESKRTIRECGAAEQANFGISAYGWSLWLRDCVHGVEDELCGALFALKLSSLLASSVLHTASHSARNASQVIETSIKGATGARISQRKVGGGAVNGKAQVLTYEQNASILSVPAGVLLVKITPPESYGEHTPRYPNDAHNSYFYATLPIRVTNQMRLLVDGVEGCTPSPRQAQYLLTRRAEPGLPFLELPAYCLARP